MRRLVVAFAVAAVVAAIAAFVAVSIFTGSPDDDPAVAVERSEDGGPVMVGAGDIADSDSPATEKPAALLDGIDGTVFTLGDNVQGRGTAEEFARYYDPTWGRHKDRTKPAVGNHEYRTPEASPYFEYFGDTAGDPDKGYYSYDLGEWHVVVLNTNCEKVGGCGAESPQVRWLKEDLAANSDKACTLAMGHHPLFTSGDKHGPQNKMKPLYEELYAAGVEAILSGSEGNYERFAPQDPQGNADPQGIRQFIVGTGGHYLSSFGDDVLPNSEVRNADTHGVIKLTLRSDGYDWEFIPVGGETFTDSGSARCHQ